MIARIFGGALIAVIAQMWIAEPAFAYIDPGTGHMLFQTVIGAVAAAGVAFATGWRWLRSLFQRRKADPIAPHQVEHQKD